MTTSSIPQKQCSKCKQFFDATTKYFETDRSKKDGLYSSCRRCKNIKVRYVAPDGFRRCTICNETFPETIEHFRLYKKGTQFYAKCHDCERKKDAIIRKENPSKFQSIQKKFRDNNPERSKEIKQKWVDKNPAKVKAHGHKRRKLIMANGGSFNSDDLKKMYEEQEGRCAYCGISIYWSVSRDIHVDHIKPVSKGGSNWPDNLCLSCADCNLSKGEKSIEQWKATRGW